MGPAAFGLKRMLELLTLTDFPFQSRSPLSSVLEATTPNAPSKRIPKLDPK